MAVKASATVTLSSVVDVKSVWRYYKLQASTLSKPSKPTTNPPSGWTTTEPSYTEGSTNSLYFCDLTVFCDNTFVYSDVSLSSSYEAAKTAYNKALAAQNTANTANNTANSKGIDYSQGKMLYTDPTFASGLNSIRIYNNSNNSNVTVTRTAKSSDNPFAGASYELTIANTGTSSPGCGGFLFSNASRANAVFIYRIFAKIPTSHNIGWAANAFGTGATITWLTSRAGTGKFTEYVCKAVSGATGTFSTIGYFYINGAVGTADAPVKWYVAYATCFDMTNNSDILTTRNDLVNNYTKRSYLLAQGNGDTSKYMQICTFKVVATYANMPITITLGDRGMIPSKIMVGFYSYNGTDPTVDTFVRDGGKPAYIAKLGTSSWGLYVEKSESYALIDVSGYVNPMSSRVQVTWTGVNTASLPTGTVIEASQLIGSELKDDYVSEAKMTTTTDEIRMDFNTSLSYVSSDLQSQIADGNTAANNKFAEINKYIRFVDGKIILGETGNTLVLTIQNDRVSFTQSGVEVAYFSNNNLYVKRAEVLNTMRIGNYEWTPRNDGALALRKRSV